MCLCILQLVILVSTRLFLQLKNTGNSIEHFSMDCLYMGHRVLPNTHISRVDYVISIGIICHFCTCIRVFLISICSNSERQLPFGRSLFHLFAAIAPVQLWSLG